MGETPSLFFLTYTYFIILFNSVFDLHRLQHLLHY